MLREIKELRQADDPYGLVLHDRLQHLDMPLKKIYLALDLARQNAAALHFPLPSVCAMITLEHIIGFSGGEGPCCAYLFYAESEPLFCALEIIPPSSTFGE